MPAVALTTTAKQLALRKPGRQHITFTGDLAGSAIYYLVCSALGTALPVAGSVFDYAVGAGIQSTFSIVGGDSKEIVEAAWYAISDTATKLIGVSDG